MKEYTIIGTFNYKGNKYELLIDADKKFFFLRINEKEEEEYIALKELIELTNHFSYNNCVLLAEKNKKGRKRSIIPKIIVGALLIAVTVSFVSILNKVNSSRMDLSQPNRPSYSSTISAVENDDPSVSEDKTQKVIDELLEDIEKQTKDFKVEDMQEGIHLKIIFDNSKLEEVTGNKKEDVTYDMIREIIKKNSNIPEKFKKMYLELADNLESQYPNMDLRVWYENLKTIKILEVDEMQMKVKAISATAYACYRKDENTIYTVKDYDYVPGTWDYQVIIHEMCHPIRSSFFKDKNGDDVRVQFESQSGDGVIIGEALNSLFALRSYDKEEKDIAYQLQSNMLEAMIESMDHYTYQDYIEHNITYLENELNKQNGDEESVRMLGLMELQYKDYHDDDISVGQETFHPLYDYIAKMYYAKRINPNMSYEEALKVKDELVNRITYDVPAEYNIDTNHFQVFFDNYCQELGIQDARTK